jgi:hypothetical protein
MFQFASDFNQQLCWDVSGKDTNDMFDGAGITQAASLTGVGC